MITTRRMRAAAVCRQRPGGPFGNVDLSSLFGMFNAASPLDPGDAFTGLDDATSTAAGSFDLFDPSSWI